MCPDPENPSQIVESARPAPKVAWGLFRLRLCPVPTWRGLLLLAVCTGLAAWVVVFSVHPFLAVSSPLTNGVLVVEGWLPDYTLRQALEEFRSGNYSDIYVTGGPLEYGGPLSGYNSYAAAGAATLAALGMDTNRLRAVPAPKVVQDRTYASAVALRSWLKSQDARVDKITVLSHGVHARRSRLLFSMAFGSEVEIGCIAAEPEDYNADNWWRTSAGVRNVIGEILAYGYARLVFRP